MTDLRDLAQAALDRGETVGSYHHRAVIQAIDAGRVAPETWTCPTCHTPMPADAAVGHLRGEIDVETLAEGQYHGITPAKLAAEYESVARRLRADAAASGSGGETT